MLREVLAEAAADAMAAYQELRQRGFSDEETLRLIPTILTVARDRENA